MRNKTGGYTVYHFCVLLSMPSLALYEVPEEPLACWEKKEHRLIIHIATPDRNHLVYHLQNQICELLGHWCQHIIEQPCRHGSTITKNTWTQVWVVFGE